MGKVGQENLKNYDPVQPVKPGVGVLTRLWSYFKIFKPLNEAVDRKQVYYEQCLEAYPNI